MKKLSALLLSLLLLLTACGTPATPGDAVTLPTPNDEILVEEGLHAEDLPEVCRLWFDLAETSGAADKNSKLPLASRADEGACNYLAVRLPGGTYTDLIQEGKLADEGVTLADFSGGRAKQEGSYGRFAWNGELYHAFTVSAEGLRHSELLRAGRRHPPSEHFRRLHRGRRRHGVRLLRGF